MPVALALSFPAGRFHATAWGRHVNEGAPDWPPAPWRMLRALVAVWKRTLAYNALVNDHLPAALAQLIEPPLYKLPPATLAHTRHYMPSEKQTLVFDAFVSLSPTATVGLFWPSAALTPAQQQALELTLANLNYLGRAESWCSARLADWDTLPGEPCAWVDSATGEIHGPASAITETARLLCPDPGQWNQWSYGRKAHRPEPLWNLLAETADLHAEGWSDPPGARWVTYLRPAQALTPPPPARRLAPRPETRPTLLRFALAGPVLPRVTETVYVAELARRRVQGIFGKLFAGASSPVFSGKTPAGQPLPAHQHAFFLPVDTDADGRLDHLWLLAPGGFSPQELAALDVWRETRGHDSMTLNVLWEDQAAMPGISARWQSVTPFVPTRHYKERGAKRDRFPREQLPEMNLREELARRGLPEPVRVTTLKDLPLKGRSLPWRYFRQQRVFGAGRRGADFGVGFELEFAEPVAGPLAVGYACHFGLGLFLPVP